MKFFKKYSLLVFAIALSLPSVSGADVIRANLDGYQVVPSVSTTGKAGFVARIDRDSKVIYYRLSYKDLEGDVLQAHIHFGRPATNGGIVAFLCTNLGNEPEGVLNPKPACPGTKFGTVRGIIEPGDIVSVAGVDAQGIAPGEYDEVLDAIDKGAAYVVVHTSLHPPGELRGNIPAKLRFRIPFLNP